jgi:hypothetical protein
MATPDNIIAAIDLFVCSQIPEASEATFSYQPTLDPTGVPYKVQLLFVYDNASVDAVATRNELHTGGVAKMEDYLSSNLSDVLKSQFVENLRLDDGAGKFGVALRNSQDRIEREQPSYY